MTGLTRSRKVTVSMVLVGRIGGKDVFECGLCYCLVREEKMSLHVKHHETVLTV